MIKVVLQGRNTSFILNCVNPKLITFYLPPLSEQPSYAQLIITSSLFIVLLYRTELKIKVGVKYAYYI